MDKRIATAISFGLLLFMASVIAHAAIPLSSKPDTTGHEKERGYFVVRYGYVFTGRNGGCL
jgi:hypothetical protein